MAARRFALPNIQDLSKDQERARLRPQEGRHLIVGGPGTGKSIIALLRTRRYHRSSGPQDYVFLVYNRLLLEASKELVSGDVNAHPWISWFKAVFKRALVQSCPVIDGKAYQLDWKGIADAINGADEPKPPVTPFLIIDEGQDMPQELYQVLAELGFEHFYVVADQNQQITDDHSSIRDIENALDIEPGDRIELTDNYRNCDRVARLALALCIEDLASPCAKLPKGRPCAGAPVLVDYGKNCRWDFETVVERILKLADRHPAKLIGIITPDHYTRERWLERLHEHQVLLDHGRPRIVTYPAGDSSGDYRFSEGGIFVINAQSAKGLEFDTVVLADIDRYHCHHEDPGQLDDIKRRFYVMVSRARERVVLLRQAGQPCPVEKILPTDKDILQYWR
jgi:superfamily I DNA and RNA helicase